MKRFLLILLVIVAAFGVIATVNSMNKQPAAATPAAVVTPASADTTTPEPAVIRSVDMDALRALHSKDEAALTLGSESVSWEEFCEWLGMTARQIEDYFRQMQAYYGMTADWEGSVGDGSGMNFAQYTVHETNESLSGILSYRAFAAEKQVTLSAEEQEQLTDEGLAKALMGESATVEQFKTELEKEGLGIETYRRVRETNLLLDHYYDETYGHDGEKLSDEAAIAYQEKKGYVSAGHILFMTIDPNTGDKLDEAVITEKRLQAESIAKELQAIEDEAERERRFLELKEEFCEDGGKKAYPNGYTYTAGTMVSEFENAVNALEPYAVSDPVESTYGYHVIMRLPLRPDSLLYSAQGTPLSARAEAAVAGMNEELEAYMEAHPVQYADGVEDLDLTKYLK